MKKSAYFCLASLVMLGSCRMALAHLDASHSLTIVNLDQFLKSHQITLQVPDSLRMAPLYGKIAAHTLEASIRRALVGYNYVIESGPDGKPRKVVVTGTNDDGADNPASFSQSRPLGSQPASPKRFTSYLKAVPNPKAIRDFNLTADQVKQLEPDERIVLQLPEGEVAADVTRRGLSDLGGEVVVAKVDGGGRLQAVYGRDGSIYGRVYTDYGNYRIVEDNQGHPVIFDMGAAGTNQVQKHKHLMPLHRKQQGKRQGRPVAAAQIKKLPMAAASPETASPESFLARWKREASVVDMLIYRDQGITDAMIDYEILGANQAFIDSQVLIRVRAVHVASYNAEGLVDPAAEYTRKPWDPEYRGIFAGADQLREQVGADIVAFLINDFKKGKPSPGINAGGASLVRMGEELMSFPEDALMSVTIGPLTEESAFAHELGHVFGLQHAHEDGGNSPEEQWIFPYASGYYNGIVGTIMSYSADFENQPIVYSNPNLDCFGAPCGQPGYADAAAALNQVRDIVANFYPTRVLLTPADGSYRESAVVRHNLFEDSKIYQELWTILGGDPLVEVWGNDSGSDSLVNTSNQETSDQISYTYDGPANCADIYQKGQSVGDGWYQVQLGDMKWQKVFCVMTIPGYEGFTLIGRSVPQDPLPSVKDLYPIYNNYDDSMPFRTDEGAWSFTIRTALRGDGLRYEGGLYIPNTKEVLLYDMTTSEGLNQAEAKEAEALAKGYTVTRWIR